MTMFVPTTDPDVVILKESVVNGDVATLRGVVARRPALVVAAFGDAEAARSCLHVATDWPGHFSHVGETIDLLVAAGADVDAPFIGAHAERPLHWAASSGDLAAIDALVAAGADLEAPGGVLTGGAPLDDAIIFDLHDAARRLIEHGATTKLFHAAALGMAGRVRELLAGDPAPIERTSALWHACRHGHRDVAELLVAAGADPDFEGFADTTTRQAAAASGDASLVALLDRSPG